MLTASTCPRKCVPPSPGSIPWDGPEPLEHGGAWPKARCWPQSAAFCRVGGCGVMGAKGQREARDALGQSPVVSGTPAKGADPKSPIGPSAK